MQLFYFFVIAIVAILALSCLVVLIFWKALQNLISQNLTLTNLATSKDLETFRNLQAMRNSPSLNLSQPNPSDEAVSPLDDVTISARLAQHYQSAGLDPNMAYDEASFEEFGGLEEFRT